MVFSLETVVNDFINSSFVVETFSNPIYVALLVTVMIMFIMFLTLRSEVKLLDSSTGNFFCVTFTVGIYVMMASLGIMTIQNKIINKHFDKIYGNHAVSEATMGGLLGSDDVEGVSGAAEDEVDFDLVSDESSESGDVEVEKETKPKKTEDKKVTITVQ